MHSKVDRNQYVVFGENVHPSGPAPDWVVTLTHDLGVEEGVEGVHLGLTVPLPTLHQLVHVEIDDL